MEEKKEIFVHQDEQKGSVICISRNLLKRLYSLSNSSSIHSILVHSSNTYELSFLDFKEILKDTISSVDYLLDTFIPNSIGQKAIQKMEQDNLAYIELRKNNVATGEWNSQDGRRDLATKIAEELRNGKSDLFYQMLVKMTNCQEDFKHIMQIVDFHLMKDDYFQNIEFFKEPGLVEYYHGAFQRAIDEFDMDALDTLFLEIRTKILNHWREFTTDVSKFKNGNPFYFLCHSTSETHFSGEFWHRFVSCSLLTPELTETFHNGFGFIFLPDNIVAARGYDMYINNEAESIEDLQDKNSYWVQIDMPERVIKETLEHANNQYSEIVIDGFHPCALFCFSLGTKTMNHNYRCVHILQKSFPNLPIVDIDLTYYQKDWLKMCLDVIAEIEYVLTNHYGSFSKQYGRRFQKFWEEFQELKKNPNYSEQDIVQLYLQNRELISKSLPWQELFSGKYDDKMIRYLLYYHESYNIDSILTGDGKASQVFTLIRMLEGYPDKEKLDLIVPDLGKFLILTQIVPFTETVFYKYRKSSKKSFSLLITLLLKEMENQEFSKIDILEAYRNRKRELEELQGCELARGRTSRKLVSHEAYYHLAYASYQDEEKELQKGKTNLHLLQEERSRLEMDIADEKERFYTHHQTQWEEFLKRIGSLFHKLNASKSSILRAQETVEKCQRQLQETKQLFLDTVGCPIEDFPAILKKAKEYLNQQIKNEDDVYSLELESLSCMIENLEKELQLYHHFANQK